MSKHLDYHAAAHAMQTGVASEMALDPGVSATDPKNLRVGVNSALVNQGALARLLVAKGVITEAEYADAVTDEMNKEVRRYEERLSVRAGRKINLV